MKLDSSSSGRITKPQREFEVKTCLDGIQLDLQVHQVGVHKFGRIPRVSHFLRVKILFVGEVLEELQWIPCCTTQVASRIVLRSKIVQGSRIGKAKKHQDDTSHHVKLPSWINHQSTWNFTNHWGSPMICLSKIRLPLNGLTHGRLIQKNKKHPRQKPVQQHVFFCTCLQIYKKVWKKIRDALVPIGILQLLLQACGREDGDEVQHGSRFLAITNDADVNWLNHKRCGRFHH